MTLFLRPSIFPHLSVDVNLRLGAWRYKAEHGRVDDLVEKACKRAAEAAPMLGIPVDPI